MSVSSVTLDEVLRAAQLRAASLVPETSGYFALAIADACARLPFKLDDAMVHLSTEGTVKVARGTEVVDPEESAGSVRDMLARLLARSIGGMPGLTGAARPRRESAEGVETVISDLEAALVPVNRAAARRALARLARETAKARDAGKLRRRARRERARELPEAPAAAPAEKRVEKPAQERRPRPAPEPQLQAETAAPRRYLPPADEVDVEVDFSEPAPAVAPAPVMVAPADPTPAEPTRFESDADHPSPLDTLAPDDPTAIDSVAMVLEQARIAAATPAAEREEREQEREPKRRGRRDAAGEAIFDAAQRKTVDDLVANFSVSQYDSDASMRSTRATIKRLAGLDPTPPPPAIASRRSLPPITASRELPLPSVHASRGRAALNATHVAWVVVGLVLAGLLGHYVPTWLDRTGASDQRDDASRLSQSN